MNKIILLLISIIVIGLSIGGAMITNTNQSAEYIAMMNRNASTSLDAALFNPAGLSFLEDGTYLYLSTQTIWQTREVSVFDDVYNKSSYKGDTFVPVYPNFYLAHKRNALTLFGGFMPIGGGGSASYEEGLPSFDELLASYIGTSGVTGYSVDASFTGSSIYYAGQVGAAYGLNDKLSVALALRFVSAINTYEGSLENATLYVGTTPVTGLVPNILVDSKRTGSGYTAVLSLDFAPSDKMLIGLRFEPKTKLELVSDTKEDGTSAVLDPQMFPDDVTYGEDIPAQFGAGISYMVSEKLRAEWGFNYWMNTACDWDGDEELVVNDFNTGLALEYSLSDDLSLSAGYLFATTGPTEEYNTDLDFGVPSNTVGAGLSFAVNPNMLVTVSTSNTFYGTTANDKTNPFFKQEYDKSAFVVAFGIQYKLK